MKISNLKINKKICSLFIAGTLMLTGCGKVTMDDPIYFDNVDDASAKCYYLIDVNDKEYFIEKNTLMSAIPTKGQYCRVGLRVDEKGNTKAVKAREITDSDDAIYCLWEDDIETVDGSKSGVYISDVDYATALKGYRIRYKGVIYDVSKEDVVNAMNEVGTSVFSLDGGIGVGSTIEFETNKNGGKDIIMTK